MRQALAVQAEEMIQHDIQGGEAPNAVEKGDVKRWQRRFVCCGGVRQGRSGHQIFLPQAYRLSKSPAKTVPSVLSR